MNESPNRRRREPPAPGWLGCIPSRFGAVHLARPCVESEVPLLADPLIPFRAKVAQKSAPKVRQPKPKTRKEGNMSKGFPGYPSTHHGKPSGSERYNGPRSK
jgi:hypothetical protein